MRYLTLREVLELHGQIISQSGGTPGILNLSALESALAQPRMTFGDADLYPTIAEKAAALGFSLVNNHPFADGSNRKGHSAMEVFLVLNGFEIRALVDEQDQIVLQVASGKLNRDRFTAWLKAHIIGKI